MNKRIRTYPFLGDVAFVKSRQARRLTLSVKRWRGVRVTLPFYAPWREAEAFLAQHMDWLRDKLYQARRLEEEGAGLTDSAGETITEEALRKRALEYLPRRTAHLAQKHGFSFRCVSVRRSRTRWGSCSSVNNINLSIYLMLLPEHLTDYVIIHELVHTVHKNHSPAFWSLLDEHTGRAKALAKEIRNFRIARRPSKNC